MQADHSIQQSIDQLTLERLLSVSIPFVDSLKYSRLESGIFAKTLICEINILRVFFLEAKSIFFQIPFDAVLSVIENDQDDLFSCLRIL